MEWTVFAGLAVVFVYGEGYRAIHRRWIPRVIERARGLTADSPAPDRWLAPLYAVSLIRSDRSTIVRAWLSILTILAAFAHRQTDA